MLKTLAVIVVVAIVVVLGAASMRPDTFRIERSTTVKAPPETIFALVQDFHRWGAWSPWEKKDPSMQRTYGGAASGKGAVYGWEGNGDVGTGSMEIAEATAPLHVTIKLDFTKPFEAHNLAEFTMTPAADATRVTWAMHGPSPFLAKVMNVFVDMDHMVGSDFETGLSNLKAAAEGHG
jgi:hypothetical protein